jgi:hypothetical protein
MNATAVPTACDEGTLADQTPTAAWKNRIWDNYEFFLSLMIRLGGFIHKI